MCELSEFAQTLASKNIAPKFATSDPLLITTDGQFRNVDCFVIVSSQITICGHLIFDRFADRVHVKAMRVHGPQDSLVLVARLLSIVVPQDLKLTCSNSMAGFIGLSSGKTDIATIIYMLCYMDGTAHHEIMCKLDLGRFVSLRNEFDHNTLHDYLESIIQYKCPKDKVNLARVLIQQDNTYRKSTAASVTSLIPPLVDIVMTYLFVYETKNFASAFQDTGPFS